MQTSLSDGQCILKPSASTEVFCKSNEQLLRQLHGHGDHATLNAVICKAQSLTNCLLCSSLFFMNFRVLMVHDFSAMVPGVEVHRDPYSD